MSTINIIKELSINEKKVLLTLKKLNGKSSPEMIFESGDFQKQVEVMNSSSWLQSKKLVTFEEVIKTVYELGKEGIKFVKNGFPEKRALLKIIELGGQASLRDLSLVLEKNEIPIAIGWLKRKNWATIKKENNETILLSTEIGKKAIQMKTNDERTLEFLLDNPKSEIDIGSNKDLLSRKNVLKEKEIINGSIELTNLGKDVLKIGFSIDEEISQITTKIIKEKEFERKNIRPYDVNAFAPEIHGGKPHPLNHLISNIRQIFLEMGFEEIEGNFVESCFWNMDMLFIPQDHPAREMQDTIYCKTPSKILVENTKLVDSIAQVHENGGMTSSEGWDYKFSKDEGTRPLLRTHTTVNTIRFLSKNPNPPAKIFSIGQVFRKENIDATHLPMFYQIEGIVHDTDANFQQLIGFLSEFYKRMGFEKIRFRPGYFPYTEPSMEVDVFFNDKWMELGGSGIFRPEVTEPLGITSPVLAWGLGLERLAMLKFNLKDIRELYQSDFSWLRNQPLF
ncbi:phenylalanine--tRNA ligase subunit alpha [Thermoplasmatales archaeon ex4572_165]|nr:MAG: phenylalanine--tRNA ligase subunit alpha [Thermoplasmatales archaeon ex4572_165]